MRPERAGSDLPSRVAENLFWLGRYAERAEHAIRLLRSVVARLTDLDTTDPLELSALLHVLVELELLPERFARARAAARARRGHARRSSSRRIRTPASAPDAERAPPDRRPSSATGCRSTPGGF